MRQGFIALFLLGSGVAVACGGSVLSPDEDPDGEASQAFCEELVEAMKAYAQCTNQSPDALFYQDMSARCGRLAQKDAACIDEFAALTRCQADALTRCEADHEPCLSEEQAYAFCVSGGTCASTGGGSVFTASESAPVETFTTDESCACVEERRRPGAPPGAPPGGTCETWEDCAFICCPCAPSNGYTATVCDKSATGGVGTGRCASVEDTCATTASHCARMQETNNRLL